MLVLTRKLNQSVIIGRTVQICVLETHRNSVKLGFTGPAEIPIHREEVLLRIENNETKTPRHQLCASHEQDE